jgi:hypothetical protein
MIPPVRIIIFFFICSKIVLKTVQNFECVLCALLKAMHKLLKTEIYQKLMQ